MYLVNKIQFQLNLYFELFDLENFRFGSQKLHLTPHPPFLTTNTSSLNMTICGSNFLEYTVYFRSWIYDLKILLPLILEQTKIKYLPWQYIIWRIKIICSCFALMLPWTFNSSVLRGNFYICVGLSGSILQPVFRHRIQFSESTNRRTVCASPIQGVISFRDVFGQVRNLWLLHMHVLFHLGHVLMRDSYRGRGCFVRHCSIG